MVKSRTMSRIIGGMAIPLVAGGKVLRQNMKKALFPLELLLSEIRQADAPNLAVEASLPVLLINEGRLIKENLRKLGYNRKWLEMNYKNTVY